MVVAVAFVFNENGASLQVDVSVKYFFVGYGVVYLLAPLLLQPYVHPVYELQARGGPRPCPTWTSSSGRIRSHAKLLWRWTRTGLGRKVAGSASYLLLVKSKLGSGQGPSLPQTTDLINIHTDRQKDSMTDRQSYHSFYSENIDLLSITLHLIFLNCLFMKFFVTIKKSRKGHQSDAK